MSYCIGIKFFFSKLLDYNELLLLNILLGTQLNNLKIRTSWLRHFTQHMCDTKTIQF